LILLFPPNSFIKLLNDDWRLLEDDSSPDAESTKVEALDTVVTVLLTGCFGSEALLEVSTSVLAADNANSVFVILMSSSTIEEASWTRDLGDAEAKEVVPMDEERHLSESRLIGPPNFDSEMRS